MNLTAETIAKQAIRKAAVQNAYQVEVACKPIVKIQRMTKNKIKAVNKRLELINDRHQKLEVLLTTAQNVEKPEALQILTIQNAIKEVCDRRDKVQQELADLQKFYETAFYNACEAISNAVRVRFQTLDVMTSKKKMKVSSYLSVTCERLGLEINKILGTQDVTVEVEGPTQPAENDEAVA